MDRFEAFVNSLGYSLDTAKKQHLVGGILMSVSLLFGGLAITVMTIKTEEHESEQ